MIKTKILNVQIGNITASTGSVSVLTVKLKAKFKHLLFKTLNVIVVRFFQVLGRNVRDFINELDNLHEYFRFSFPKVQPPSFCVEEECETSLTLHYRSTRKGFTQFVKGNCDWNWSQTQDLRESPRVSASLFYFSAQETDTDSVLRSKMNKAARRSHWFSKNGDSGWHSSRFLYLYMYPFWVNSFWAKVDLYTYMTAVCNWLLQGSSLKWDGNSTTQILKWKSCPKRRLKKWHTWYVRRLRSSIISSCPVSDLDPPESLLSSWKWFHHLQWDNRRTHVYTQTASVYWMGMSVYWDGTLGQLIIYSGGTLQRGTFNTWCQAI